MESLSASHLISATHSGFPAECPLIPIRVKGAGSRLRTNQFLLYAKKPGLQDFRDYAKPLHLLPATKPEVCTGTSMEKVITSFKFRRSECLFKVRLSTSTIYGSNLSDLNAGILLCLIDGNGNAILQRIPASSVEDNCTHEGNEVVSDVMHFQRGSVDEFIFEGPKLGKIEALWISLESGQWRLAGVNLTVTCQNPLSSEENDGKEIPYTCLKYGFEVEDLLLGEGSDSSLAELRPRSIAEFTGKDFALLSESLVQPSSARDRISNEESMKEYADLKVSLLLYDTLLILAGSSIASILAGKDAGLAFLTGGIGGLLYLLLLQRSVDGLPVSPSAPEKSQGDFDQTFGGFKVTISSLALALTFSGTVIAVKYGSGANTAMLTPKELIFGMTGFLACKIAVVLAAFRPLPTTPKGNK